MPVKDHYHRAILEIMAAHHIEPPVERPDHVVPTNARFPEVVRHTHWYVGDSPEARRYYGRYYELHYRYLHRYLRYEEVLGKFLLAGLLQNEFFQNGRRKAHIDVGCGAGVFGWAFLDLAMANGLGYDRLELYGVDHCPEMINLAVETRARLMQNVANYPELHYFDSVEVLCNQLMENHRDDTDYLITFGHVLVQAHDVHAIRDFTRVIDHTFELLGDSQCYVALAAIDARRRSAELNEGWAALLNNLDEVDVHYDECDVSNLRRNDSGCAKFAWLT